MFIFQDDAFYYLTLAQNFVKFHFWTFDFGQTVTSGFHLLHAYILALLYWILKPDKDQFINASLVLTYGVWVTAFLLTWGSAVRKKNTELLACLSLLLGTGLFYYNTISIMEWAYPVLFGGIYLYLFNRILDHPVESVWVGTLIFLTSLLGSLARSDFGVLPFAVFLVTSFMYWRGWQMRTAILGLAGSVAGILFMFIHNYLFTGNLLQTSARIKAYWRAAESQFHQVSLVNLEPFLIIPTRPERVSLVQNLIYVAYLVILLAAIFPLARRLARLSIIKISRIEITLFSAAILTLIGHSWLETFNGGYQPWYSSTLIPPGVLAATCIFKFFNRIMPPTVFKKALAIGCCLVGLIFAQPIIMNHPWTSPWPHQIYMYQAGRQLSEHPLPAAVGAWNSGILGYFQGGTIINLDGLMNEDIYKFLRENRIPVYIDQKEIRYLVDFSYTFEEKKKRIIGGYDDQDFLARLETVETFGFSPGILRKLFFVSSSSI